MLSVRYPLKWETDVPEIVLLEDREADPVSTLIAIGTASKRQPEMSSQCGKKRRIGHRKEDSGVR